MPRTASKLVTVLGSAYFQPISDIVYGLTRRTRNRPTRVQSGEYESGYSASAVLLLVAMFESYVTRVRVVYPGLVPDTTRSAIGAVLKVFPKLRHRQALEDVYVLRDLLMHSHLYVVDYEWGGPVPMVMKSSALHPAFGDKRSLARGNVDTRRTRTLGLSVLPTRVDRRDLLKVFDTIWKTLLRFEKKSRSLCYVSHLHVRFAGKTILFSDLRDELEKSLQKPVAV